MLMPPSRTLPAAKRRRIYILSLERYINVLQYCLERHNMVVVVASAAGREYVNVHSLVTPDTMDKF